jgi:hypothetical protein
MKTCSAIVSATMLAAVSSASAALVPLYSQNFDGMTPTPFGTNWDNQAALPTGWKFDGGASPAFGSTTATTAVTKIGGTSANPLTTTDWQALHSVASGGAYLFVNGVAASGTDKAIGFLTTGSYTGTRSIMFRYTNNTGYDISSFTASWDYEKYRDGTRSHDWTFFSSTNGTNWTAVTAGNKSYGANNNASTVHNPPLADSKSDIAIATSVANGASLYFRWTYTGSGNTSAQALGIDNFSLTGVPAPGAAALIGLAGLITTRRRK